MRKDSDFLGRDAELLDEQRPTFRGIVWPSFSAQAVKKKRILDPEDESVTIRRNAVNHSPTDTASHPRRL